MIIFRTQIITILFIIGSQRSLANLPHFLAPPPPLEITSPENPIRFLAPPPPLEITSSENPGEHDAPQEIEETGGKGPKHNWDCQAESDFIQKQIALTSKLLSDGEKAIQKQQDLLADKTVLVLGKAGSGKTSLVQFLTKNPNLQSKIVEAGTGDYIIEDGEKIGTSATESFTLYPEIVKYNSSISFCDSPGFHDSRSSAHEIVSMDVMKSTISRFKRVKILLLENYSSLQYGLYKDNFLNTLHHLNDFLNDIDRYKDNIVLIATKVPRTFIATDDTADVVTEVTDEMHIESIIKYLNLTEASIAEKLDQDIEESKNGFYQKVIKLLQSLQARDENGKATRINVFRRPYKSGPLTNMTLLKKNKESLTKTIMHLDSVEVLKNDFDFTLSNEAKMYLECLLKLTSDNYKNKINEVSFKLNEFVDQKVQNYTSFFQVLSELELLHDALKKLSENLDETRNYNEFFEKIYGFITDQKIPLPINYNERIHVLEKYEKMLSKFVNTSTVFIPSSWTHPIRQVIRSTKDELQWYRALKKFISGLSNYERQKNKTEIYSTVFREGTTLSNGLMTLFMEVTESTDLKQFIDALSNPRKRSEVEAIPKTLLMRNNVTCDDGKLIVKGFHVFLSEINSDHLIQSYCSNITVKEISLLAVDTVFLDEDTIDNFKEVSMFIAAPKWEVIGKRRIVLSGQPGPEISEVKPYVDDGKDGKPGLPGGNAGSVFGIGSQFLNGENLYIESNGGTGGPGSNGAKGEKGSNGLDAEDIFKTGYHYENSTFEFKVGAETYNLVDSLQNPVYEKKFTLTSCYQSCSSYYNDGYYRSSYYESKQDVSTEVKVIMKEGECGVGGYRGGLGGEAGIGGFAGDVKLIELGNLSQIKVQNQNGSLGTRGRRGENGDPGKDGIGMICVQVVGFTDSSRVKSYWKCESTNTTAPSCKTCPKLEQAVENYIQNGIEQPAPKKTPDFVHYLLDYAILLEAHSNNTIFKKIITDFKAASQKQYSYNLNEMGLLYFKKSA